jgi:signal transduction histidine kinase
MKVFSLRFKTIDRLKTFISDNKLSSDGNILIQIYSQTDQIGEILTLLNRELKRATIIGHYSDRSLVNGIVTYQEVIINFIIFDSSKVESRYFTTCSQIDRDFLQDISSFYIVYSSNHIAKESFIDNIPSDITLVGTFYNNFIITDNMVKNSGVVVTKIDMDFDVDIKIIDIIEPVGRELKVTQKDFDGIYKIGNFTPRELYEHYLNKKLSTDLTDTSYSFPLLKKLDSNLFQSALILNENKNVMLTHNISQNDTLLLGFAHSKAFYEEYAKVIEELDGIHCDLLLTINSNARADYISKKGFNYKSGIGGFSKSELVVYKNKIYDLNLSSVIVLFNQNNSNLLKRDSYIKYDDISWDINMVDALYSIAKIASKELEDLNCELNKRVKIEVEENLKKDSLLIHNSKLAQMGEMMSMIAHQWKQPLSAISATSSGLHIKIELDMYDRDFFLKSLLKIEEYITHLSNTIDDFSNFFKPTKVAQNYSLSSIIEDALSIATYSLTIHSIKVIKDLDTTLKVVTYKNELVQVLLNIIKNAENIMLKRGIKNPIISIRTYKKNYKTVIEILDNGGGVEDDNIEKIFEPYFSTKASQDSTGLGLYMSKLIVETSLKGELYLKNTTDGASFNIVLV